MMARVARGETGSEVNFGEGVGPTPGPLPSIITNPTVTQRGDLNVGMNVVTGLGDLQTGR